MSTTSQVEGLGRQAGAVTMTTEQETPFEVEAFFDGDCPLCAKEIAMLRRWDRRGAIRFTDISLPDFDPAPLGRTFEQMMDRMHGRLPDGTLIEGVEVFRQLYAAVGFRRLVAISRWFGIRHSLDLMYRFFARYRLRLTGRCLTGQCRTGNCQISPQQSK